MTFERLLHILSPFMFLILFAGKPSNLFAEELPTFSLQKMDSLLVDSKHFGIGVSVNGTQSMDSLRYELVLHRIENHGLRKVYLEMNFGILSELRMNLTRWSEDAIKKYVLEEADWVWANQAFFSFCLRLKDFNLSNPGDEVLLLGLNIRQAGHSYSLLKAFLEKRPAELPTPKVDDWLLALKDLKGLEKENISIWKKRRALENISRVHREMAEVLPDSFDDANLGSSDYHVRLARTIHQSLIFNFNQIAGVRDRFLWENFQWLEATFPDDKPFVFVGHNSRVSKGRLTYGRIKVFGVHLKEAFGKDYKAVAMEFGNGQFLAMRPGLFGGKKIWKERQHPDEDFQDLLQKGEGAKILDLQSELLLNQAPFFKGLCEMRMILRVRHSDNLRFSINPWNSFDLLLWLPRVVPLKDLN